MIILFTGHRDKLANEDEIDLIHCAYTDSIWMHGGAIGFDTQVNEFAKKHKIKTIICRPDYKKFGRAAPIFRNRAMVDTPDVQLVIALWDGRACGGTAFTVRYARQACKEVIVLRPL